MQVGVLRDGCGGLARWRRVARQREERGRVREIDRGGDGVIEQPTDDVLEVAARPREDATRRRRREEVGRTALGRTLPGGVVGEHDVALGRQRHGEPEVVALVGGEPVGDHDRRKACAPCRRRRRSDRAGRKPQGRRQGEAPRVDDGLLLGQARLVRGVRAARGRADARRRLVGHGAAVGDARIEERTGGRMNDGAAEPVGALRTLLHGHEVARVAEDPVVVEVGQEVGVGDVGDVVVGHDRAQVDELGGQLLGQVDRRVARVCAEGGGDLGGELLADGRGGLVDDLGEGVLAEGGARDVLERVLRPVQERGQRVHDALGVGGARERRRRGACGTPGGRGQRDQGAEGHEGADDRADPATPPHCLSLGEGAGMGQKRQGRCRRLAVP